MNLQCHHHYGKIQDRMGEDCDDGVRSLRHSCLHSLLYEHGQGGQCLVIDHYHDHGYDHHHH